MRTGEPWASQSEALFVFQIGVGGPRSDCKPGSVPANSTLCGRIRADIQRHGPTRCGTKWVLVPKTYSPTGRAEPYWVQRRAQVSTIRTRAYSTEPPSSSAIDGATRSTCGPSAVRAYWRRRPDPLGAPSYALVPDSTDNEERRIRSAPSQTNTAKKGISFMKVRDPSRDANGKMARIIQIPYAASIHTGAQ